MVIPFSFTELSNFSHLVVVVQATGSAASSPLARILPYKNPSMYFIALQYIICSLSYHLVCLVSTVIGTEHDQCMGHQRDGLRQQALDVMAVDFRASRASKIV